MREPRANSGGANQAAGATLWPIAKRALRSLCMVQLPDADLASIFGVSLETLIYWKKTDAEFAAILSQSAAEGRLRVRQALFENRHRVSVGNWLNENWLGALRRTA